MFVSIEFLRVELQLKITGKLMQLQGTIAMRGTTAGCIFPAMNSIGKRIALARELRGWNQSELAREMNVTPQSVQAWESGKNVPRPQKMTRLAEVLGVRVGELVSDDVIEGEFHRVAPQLESNIEPGPPITSPYRSIKILGTAQMGTEGYWYALEEADGVVDAYSRDAGAYALKLKGDSMEPAINSGWIAVIEPSLEYFPGEYVMVRTTEGESMLKRLLYCNDVEVSLLSVNGHAIRNIPIEQIEHIHSVGAIVPPSRARV